MKMAQSLGMMHHFNCFMLMRKEQSPDQICEGYKRLQEVKWLLETWEDGGSWWFWNLLPQIGTQTQPKPCLGLEPTWLGLKPSQNSQYLVSGPNEAQVLDVSLQKEFSERQEWWVRSEFIQRKTYSTDRVWAISEDERPWNMWWLVFTEWVLS